MLGEELAAKLKDSESQLEESQAMVKMLSIPPRDVPGADRHELLRLLDRRQHEIDQLSEEWKVQSAKLASMALEKSEFQTRFEFLGLDTLISKFRTVQIKRLFRVMCFCITCGRFT